MKLDEFEMLNNSPPSRSTQEVTHDGYLIVNPESRSPAIKGIQCGKCAMRFEYNQSYGYHCPDLGCPLRA